MPSFKFFSGEKEKVHAKILDAEQQSASSSKIPDDELKNVLLDETRQFLSRDRIHKAYGIIIWILFLSLLAAQLIYVHCQRRHVEGDILFAVAASLTVFTYILTMLKHGKDNHPVISIAFLVLYILTSSTCSMLATVILDDLTPQNMFLIGNAILLVMLLVVRTVRNPKRWISAILFGVLFGLLIFIQLNFILRPRNEMILIPIVYAFCCAVYIDSALVVANRAVEEKMQLSHEEGRFGNATALHLVQRVYLGVPYALHPLFARFKLAAF